MHPAIDRYKILRSLNKGGMGEVFLAYDPLCKREVALKQILPELKQHAIIKERFLREAEIASQLAHPSILPIFSIDPHEEKEYYTMPYIEGETLKQILKKCLEEEKRGEVVHPIGSSLPALMRLFLNLCEAINYAHSKGIIHRDLKPDNLIIGTYGQLLLLDWGLADRIGGQPGAELSCDEEESSYKDLTRPGKVPGTLNYIAPERLLGGPSSVSIDIYSLGVILYQLLTLRCPFLRTSVKEYKKTMHTETLIDPQERAPYREIPDHLSTVAKKCLLFNPEERFTTVSSLISEITSFLEGRPEWVNTTSLDPMQSSDWEFQENILLSKHAAITRSPESMQWVHLMLSKESFPSHLRIETRLLCKRGSQGIGILIGVPSREERRQLAEGLSLHLSSTSSLLHNLVEVMQLPGASLSDEEWHSLRIEKLNHQLFFYLDDTLVGHYILHIPLAGSHLGLLYYDADSSIEPLKVSSSSQTAEVSCLAIPDAFFADRQYHKARLEYQKISHSFSGRQEGREAIFRAALTLIEEAKGAADKESLLALALTELDQLHHTPGAPLEYLGKSLVYKASGESEEEVKCLELALRKYKNHPFVPLILEQILFRLYESASSDRLAAYQLALLTLRQLPHTLSTPEHRPLLMRLSKNLEKSPLFLLEGDEEEELAVELCLWLGKPIPLVEIIESSSSLRIISGALYTLIALGNADWAEEHLHLLKSEREKALLVCALNRNLEGLLPLASSPDNSLMRCAYFLFLEALSSSDCVLPYFSHFPSTPALDSLHILHSLKSGKLDIAAHLINAYPTEILHDETSPLFIPMGFYLLCTEGKEIALAHFALCLDLPYPPTTMLFASYLLGKAPTHLLFWEQEILKRQLALYHTLGYA